MIKRRDAFNERLVAEMNVESKKGGVRMREQDDQTEEKRLMAVREAFWANTPEGHDDFVALHEVLISAGAVGNPSPEQVKSAFMMLPADIIGSALSLGFNDTEVRRRTHDFLAQNHEAVLEQSGMEQEPSWIRAIIREMQAVARQILPPEVSVHIHRRLHTPDDWRQGERFWNWNGKDLLSVTLSGDHQVGYLRLAAVHALHDLGLFTANEWETLQATARKQDWIAKHRIRERHLGQALEGRELEEGLLQLAVAEEYGHRSHPMARPASETALGRFFERIGHNLARLASGLQGGDGQIAADIFDAIDNGTIARRSKLSLSQEGSSLRDVRYVARNGVSQSIAEQPDHADDAQIPIIAGITQEETGVTQEAYDETLRDLRNIEEHQERMEQERLEDAQGRNEYYGILKHEQALAATETRAVTEQQVGHGQATNAQRSESVSDPGALIADIAKLFENEINAIAIGDSTSVEKPQLQQEGERLRIGSPRR